MDDLKAQFDAKFTVNTSTAAAVYVQVHMHAKRHKSTCKCTKTANFLKRTNIRLGFQHKITVCESSINEKIQYFSLAVT